MKIKKSMFWMGMIFVVLVVAGFFLNSGSSLGENVNGIELNGVVSAASGDVQVVKMHVEGSQYIFEPSSVKKGIPVRLEADMSRMPGCSRGIMGSELGIRKTFSSNDNTLEFTPDKAGTFYIACSMNMYKGTLTVLESDGSKPSYVQTPTSAAGTCGMGGGCGCGG